MYCAVSNALEQCKTEGVVDVFQVTKAVRMQKPGAVTTLVIPYNITVTVNSILYTLGAVQVNIRNNISISVNEQYLR